MRTRVLLLVALFIAVSAQAQIPSLVVTPSKATLTSGQWQMFRAVGTDGRLLTGVQWSVSPAYAAELRTGDEAEVSSITATHFEIIAHYEGRTASATVTVVSGYSLPEGTSKWVVMELPGFKTVKLIPAYPTAGGADVFAEETLGSTRIIRAYTEDGRELWRTVLHGELSAELIAEQSAPSIKKKSVCDAVKIGDAKKDVAALPQATDYSGNSGLFGRGLWSMEENGVTCHVYFDADGKVARKRREVTNQ